MYHLQVDLKAMRSAARGVEIFLQWALETCQDLRLSCELEDVKKEIAVILSLAESTLGSQGTPCGVLGPGCHQIRQQRYAGRTGEYQELAA